MQNIISHHSPLAPPRSTGMSVPWYSCQGNRETRQPPPIQCTVHRTELKRHRDETWRDTPDSVDNPKPRAWDFIPHPPRAFPSTLPLHLDYFSWLIGLWAEDVPGVCQGEIAMVSKCPSVLAGMTWNLIPLVLTWKEKKKQKTPWSHPPRLQTCVICVYFLHMKRLWLQEPVMP